MKYISSSQTGRAFYKKLPKYIAKQGRFKKKLNECLHQIRPDITISLLRRDINFINRMTDGSTKLGEIHFNKSNYRDFSNSRLPAFLRAIVSNYWREQLYRQLRQLKRFIVLSHEDAQEWTELDNVEVIHNPLPFFPTKYLTIAINR